MLLISDHVWGVITLWQEARGESHAGKVAVAEVILQRAKQHYSSDGTIADTCLRSYQFTGWNTTDPNRAPSVKLDDADPVVKECQKAWDEAVTNVTTDNTTTKSAVLYYNPRIPQPSWVANSEFVASIDHHNFYRPNG